MNQLTLYGHLGKDPEKHTSQNGVEYWILNIAERIYRKGQEDETLWWRVTVFSSRLTAIIKSLKKGYPVIIYGEMDLPKIFEGEDGEPRFSLSCKAHKICFSPFGIKENLKESKKETNEDISSVLEKEEEICPF